MIVLKNPKLLKEDLLRIGTITSAAEYTGYSKAYISSIVTGSRNPNPDVAIRTMWTNRATFWKIFFYSKCSQKDNKIKRN